MDLSALTRISRAGKGTTYTFFGGKVARHPHARLPDDVEAARKRLQDWGVVPGMRVGIYAPNSYEWMVHDLALIDLRAISVPFTADFSMPISREILERYNVALLLISQRDHRFFPDRPAHIALIDAPNSHVAVIDLPAIHEPDEADQLSHVFSSGSAGGLKGMVVSRRGVEETMPPIYDAIGVTPKDRLLLFLPMSNFQQRAMGYAALTYDFDLVITDYTELFAALKTLNPTILVAPPIFYQMIHAERAESSGGKNHYEILAARLLKFIPIARLRRAAARKVFPGFHKQFGKNMRVLITGMAPIRREIGEFFEQVQLPLSESYGLMEAGSITYRPPGSRKSATVGRVLPGINLEFQEDGEIIVHRKHSLCLRYFQCADGENQRTFIEPGHIATGDIGRLDRDGDLVLLGRKKELIVTPGGVKIHPEVIEQEVDNFEDVTNSVVMMRPNASHLTCIICLKQPETEGARDRIKKLVNQLKATRGTTPFVEVLFADVPFTVANGMLRPNMKIDRKRIAAKYNI